ncbi:C-C motif chemokine 21-like [Centropristis striata]|uniref:C-C motif chemokine 21-like n=1 Tax=Centropristis striata TaxID=184440 RepID=UPI0027DEEB6F|nr:C-C motif chemokine 21-like [Centropristis striata]
MIALIKICLRESSGKTRREVFWQGTKGRGGVVKQHTFTLLKRLTEAASLSSELPTNREMASRTALLLLLGVICLGFATAEVPVDCCLKVTEKRFPLQLILSYTVQEAGKGCDLSATAFLTKQGRRLCVSHPNDQAWVQSHITHIDRRPKN